MSDSAHDPNINPHDQASIYGDLFQQNSGKSTPCRLRVAVEQVVITQQESETVLLSGLRRDMKISDRVGKIARRITFPDGSSFITHDNDATDRLLGTSASKQSVNWLEQFRPRLALVVLVAIAMVFTAYRYGLPAIVSAAVTATPNAVIKQISKASLVGLGNTLFKPTKQPQARQDKLTDAFNHLVAQSSNRVRSLEPKLHFRTSVVGPNAFALPDGTIIVTDALLKLVDDDVIIGVLGHELGHVHHQHGLRLIYRSAGFIALISLVAGDVGGVMEEILLQGAGILTLSYNRKFELQADGYSIKLLTRAGHNPTSILPFFGKIKQLSPDSSLIPDWLSTHPQTDKRIEAIKKQTGKEK